MTKGNRNRISFSLRKEYQHVYNFLEKQPNVSDFICRLIQKELEKELSQITLEEKVDQLLSAISKQQGILVCNQSLPGASNIEEQDLKGEDIELINELF